MGNLGTFNAPTTGKPISEKQLPWLLDMTREFWTLSATITGEDTADRMADALARVEGMTSREASSAITNMRETLPTLRQTARYASKTVEPPVSAAPVVEIDTDGIYVLDGAYYRVQRSGAGRLYAKRLDTDARRWDYAPGMVGKIRPDHRITAEHAASLPFSFCIRCTKDLSREDSIARRMGATCYAKSIG